MNLPYEMKQETLWIVRGYELRLRAYRQMRAEILGQQSAGTGDGMPRGDASGSSTERKAALLAQLETLPEVRKMRAVECALRQVGQDVQDTAVREKLRNAILCNCRSGRQYPFERLGLDGFSRRDFYRRKERFLLGVANFLEMQ